MVLKCETQRSGCRSLLVSDRGGLKTKAIIKNQKGVFHYDGNPQRNNTRQKCTVWLYKKNKSFISGNGASSFLTKVQPLILSFNSLFSSTETDRARQSAILGPSRSGLSLEDASAYWKSDAPTTALPFTHELISLSLK